MYWCLSPISERVVQLDSEEEAIHYATSKDYIVFVAELVIT